MEVTAAHLIGIFVISFGASMFFKGVVNIQFGVTNGAEKAKFIKSQKRKLLGSSAKLTGAIFCLVGVAIALFLPSNQILFSI